MSLVLKVIKVKDFEAQGVKHKHYTCAYKGRAFGVSTLRFEKEDFIVDDKANTLTLKTDVEVLKSINTDQLTGETVQYLNLVPKSGLILADF